MTDELEASYEGGAVGTIVRDRGRMHDGGEITFTVAIDPDNHGVRLRRRLDQEYARQAADVYVDGQFAGTWYHPDQNSFSRWFDSEYDLPAEFDRRKIGVENPPGRQGRRRLRPLHRFPLRGADLRGRFKTIS